VEFRLLEEGVDEVMILASDGLWDVVNNEDALRIYNEGGKGEKGALALVQVGNYWLISSCITRQKPHYESPLIVQVGNY
jgi:hypothetical protein